MQNSYTQQSVIGPATDVAYYGISQGGVIGGGYVASSHELTRAVLGVPGRKGAVLLQFLLCKHATFLLLFTDLLQGHPLHSF